jgi:hypothetical protein
MVPGGGARAKDWLAAAGGRRVFDQETFKMLSKRFFAWVGVGVLSVATIPTLAAPQLARLAQRKPAAPASKAAVTRSTTATLKAAPTKAGTVKTTAVAHKAAALPVKKSALHMATRTTTITKTPGRLHQIHRTHVANKSIPAARKPMTLTHKATTLTHKATAAPAAHKPLSALAHKPTPASTAKKLLH